MRARTYLYYSRCGPLQVSLTICVLILQAGLVICVLLLMASQEGGKRRVVRDLASLEPAPWRQSVPRRLLMI